MIKQGNARACFVCGVQNPGGLHIDFYQPEPGSVVANINIPDTFQGWTGVVHGGVVAAILDEGAGRALLSGDTLDRLMFTVKLNVRYRKPVPVGQDLRLIGKVNEERGKVAVCSSKIVDAEGNIYAEAEAVLTNIPEEIVATMPYGPDDWRVYPDEEKKQA